MKNKLQLRIETWCLCRVRWLWSGIKNRPLFTSLAMGISILAVLPISYFLLSGPDAAQWPVFSEDTAAGKVTMENQTLKVVWHYKTLASENNNRSGGSIYELYDKRTDPEMLNNLASNYAAGGARTTPNMPGIGGLGAMHVWEPPVGNVSASDNGRYGRLISQSHYVDSAGNAVFDSEFIVKSSITDYDTNEAARPDNYRVNKHWTVYPGGQIRLDVREEILRDFMAAEPAYDFSFSRAYGWTVANSLGHNWAKTCGGPGSSGNSNPDNTLTTITAIDSSPDYDHQLLHSEFFSLYGKPGGSSVRIKMDNQGRGFENGGIFNLGYGDRKSVV